MNIKRFFLVYAMLLAAAVLNCKNSDGTQYFSGNMRDTFSVLHTVDTTTWNVTYPGVGTCVRTFKDFKANDGFAVYSEKGSACFNAGKFGKTYTTNDSSGTLWYCDFLSGKNSADEVAAISTMPDTKLLTTTGCNGKAWTKLTALDNNFSLVGTFADNFGGTQVYTNTLWTTSGFGACTFAIIYYDNTNGYFIYQQQADAGCFATNNYKFGKVFWSVDSTSKLYYCELLYGQSSYLTVANSTTKPTYSSPATAGCNGFSWTQVTRQ